MPAGAYLLKARKRVYTLTPIRPRFRDKPAVLGGLVKPDHALQYMSRVEIYTDGACRGNPGPGRLGRAADLRRAREGTAGAEALTTNNRMELRR